MIKHKVIILLLFLISSYGAKAQTKTVYWQGSISSNWHNRFNWQGNQLPDENSIVVIGEVNPALNLELDQYLYQPTISGKTTVTVHSITIKGTDILLESKAGKLTMNIDSPGKLKVLHDIRIEDEGELINKGTSLLIGGSWFNNNRYIEIDYERNLLNSITKIYAPQVEFEGKSKVVGGSQVSEFNNVSISGAITLASNVTVKTLGTLSPRLLVSGWLDPMQFKITFVGNADFTVENQATIFVKAKEFNGNYSVFPTVLKPQATIDYARSSLFSDNGDQFVLQSKVYGILKVSGDGTKTLLAPTETPAVPTTVESDIIITAGALDIGTESIDRVNSGGNLEIADYATLKLSGPANFPARFSNLQLATNSTVEYYGANQNINAISYGNLKLSGSGTKTLLEGSTNIGNTFTISNGVKVDAYLHASTVNYNGSRDQVVQPINYYNLTLSNGRLNSFSGTTGVKGLFNITTGVTADHTADATIDFNGNTQLIPALHYNNLTLSEGGAKTLSGNIFVERTLSLLPQSESGSSIVLKNTVQTGPVPGTVWTGENEITLGSSLGNLVENETNYVIGKVRTSRNLTAEENNFGGIGIKIKPNVNVGTTTVERLTGSTIAPSVVSILRTFIVNSPKNVEQLKAVIEITYFNHELNGISEDELSGYYSEHSWDLSTWKHYTYSTLTSTIDKTVVLPNITTFGRYTLASIVNPLPVELVSFKVHRKAEDAVLQWVVAKEQENSGYDVQVSEDGFTFRKIGFVKSKVTTSNTRQEYSFVDNRAGKQGILYYRLKQIDLDGKSTIYPMQEVSFSRSSKTSIAAFPNPFHESFKVALAVPKPAKAMFKIYDTTGKQIFTRVENVLAGENTIDINSGLQLPKGLYIVSVELEGQVHKLKLSKI